MMADVESAEDFIASIDTLNGPLSATEALEAREAALMDSFQCIDPDCPDAATYHDHPKKRGDVVYTPPWVAEDMVRRFRPSGRILEPAKGSGVFMSYLPAGTDWCEIAEGRDFFAWKTPVDWCVSNPPYSLTRKWFRHSYTIAQNLLYLVPLRNVFSGFGFIREIYDFGGIVEIRNYGTGSSLGFPMGNAVGAMHIQAGYTGPTRFTFTAKPKGPGCVTP